MTDEKAIEKMLYDQQQGWPLCPRCGERMPDKLTHGALSRHAKGVYICEACGTDEALRDRERQTAVRLGAGSRIQWRSSEVIDMEEMLLSLNGPWSNAACIGYCVMAMRNAGLSEKTQRKVLDELTRCFDDVSVEDAAQMKF